MSSKSVFMFVSKSVKVLWFPLKPGSLGGGLVCGSGYGATPLVNSLGFNDCLGVVSVNGMCSVCDVEPTMAWGCAAISDFCPSYGGTTCAGLLGCKGVNIFTFLLRPALPCPNLGFFQVRVLTSGDTIIGFNICFSG